MSNEGSMSIWIKLALQLAGEAVKRVGEVARAIETQMAQTSSGSLEISGNWESKILDLEREIEKFYKVQLAEMGIDAVMLSKESGSPKVEPRCAPEDDLDRPIYFVSDPINSTFLYRREMPVYWYTALAIYTRFPKEELAEPLAAVVADCLTGKLYFCDSKCSYEGRFTAEGRLEESDLIIPNQTDKLSEAILETYQIKTEHIHPIIEKYKSIFREVKFILPNGGPGGFCDVAAGTVDVFFDFKPPRTDIFPGIAIARKAGCKVSTFEGYPVKFEEKVEKRYNNVVCSANEALHEKVLKLLKANGFSDNVVIEKG
ncbi:MAG TPA: inositol monophosphatase family protein [archaeon]|nr:inositol monophosphatase family protein [archaeon]